MRKHMYKHLLIMLSLLTCFLGCSFNNEQTLENKMVHQPDNTLKPLSLNRHSDFNQNWQFQLSTSSEVNSSMAQNEELGTWQPITLPHDWSIEHEFSEQYNGATAYLPGGVGWYQKEFISSSQFTNNLVYLYFDGIYANSELWLNGKKIGGRINGYSPFFIELSNYLKPEGEFNQLKVKVDHQNYIDSRWYTGSGIYRDVSLIITNKLHIPVWGSFVTSDVDLEQNNAKVNVEVKVDNTTNTQQGFQLLTEILDEHQQVVTSVTSKHQLQKQTQITYSHQLDIDTPNLWDINSPNLYTARTSILKGTEIIDVLDTKFGIRDIHFDANKGFFLNGQNIKIKGVNLHHDAGLVGTAVPDKVWRRRLLKLKEAGTNAIRTAHNPVSQRFLDLCDELGFLVQAEIFDEWDNPKDKRLNQWERHSDAISRGYAEHFQTQAERDLKDSMLRDRNHPSIFMWSIGNEIEWTYPRYKEATGYFDMNAKGNYFHNPPFISPEEIYNRFHNSEEQQYVLADTAQKLSKWVKEIDTTRPVTANLILPSVSHISGYADALDVVGYSYRRVIYDYGHRLFPDKVIMGTENVPQWHEWKAIEERDFISGTFLWSGIDYLGESHKAWPRKTNRSGLLNSAGFAKPSFHMYKTLWNAEPHIQITTQLEDKSLYKKANSAPSSYKVVEKEPGKWQRRVWVWQDVNRHWNYSDKETVIVEVLSNCAEVELFLNGQTLGVEGLKENNDHILKWAIPFSPGTLTAKGKGECSVNQQVSTADQGVNVQVNTDLEDSMKRKGDITHIEMLLLDKQRLPVSHQEQLLTIKVSDNLKLLGTDSGRSQTITHYGSNEIWTFEGKALAIVKAKDNLPAKVEIFLADKLVKTLVL